MFLLTQIKACNICAGHLPLAPRPILQAHEKSKILIIGQAPGLKAHNSQIPWNDPSGNRLREWLGVNREQFYDPQLFAYMPMGFCYPGTSGTGDLPPRPECAPHWHKPLLSQMKEVKLTILIGLYALKYYLKDKNHSTLTDTVVNYQAYLPQYLPLPHPSPRNQAWFKKNPFFDTEVVPLLKTTISPFL